MLKIYWPVIYFPTVLQGFGIKELISINIYSTQRWYFCRIKKSLNQVSGYFLCIVEIMLLFVNKAIVNYKKPNNHATFDIYTTSKYII